MSIAMDEEIKLRKKQEEDELNKAIYLSQLEYDRTLDKLNEEDRILQQKLLESQNDEITRQEREKKELQEKKKIEDEKRRIEEEKKTLEEQKKELDAEKAK